MKSNLREIEPFCPLFSIENKSQILNLQIANHGQRGIILTLKIVMVFLCSVDLSTIDSVYIFISALAALTIHAEYSPFEKM